MKVWNTYASEHSMNLVMIGKFKEAHDAEAVKRIIDRLTEQVASESGAYDLDSGVHRPRFSDEMRDLLSESQFHSASPSELGQFELDIQVELQGRDILITTDEIEVSVFLKLLVDKGARVEVYSAHDYPDVKKGH